MRGSFWAEARIDKGPVGARVASALDHLRVKGGGEEPDSTPAQYGQDASLSPPPRQGQAGDPGVSLGWHPLTLQSAASASGAHSAPFLPASQPAHPGPAGAGAAPRPPRCPPATEIGVRDPEGQGPACPTSWPSAPQQGLTTRNTRGPSAALLSTRIHLLDMALLKPTLPLGSRWGNKAAVRGARAQGLLSPQHTSCGPGPLRLLP